MKNLIRRFSLIVFTLGLVLWAVNASGYKVNLTTSMPQGIYHVSPLVRPIRKGDVVWFCPPDTVVFRQARDERGYIPHGDCSGDYLHMLKPVVAVAGDTVEVSLDGVSVNGKRVINSESMTHDPRGRNMIPMLGTFKVQPGNVWLVSHFNLQSYDSRYFGPIPKGQVVGIARPVWVSVMGQAKKIDEFEQWRF